MKNYQVIRNAVNPQSLSLVKNALLLMKDVQYFVTQTNPNDRNKFADGIPVKDNCWSNYGGVVTESLLLEIQPQVEKAVNKKLFPTYSFSRIYWPGAVMEKHVDRPACEYSVSLCVDVNGDPWPIWFENESVILYPGDMVVYKGTEIEHWREPYQGQQQLQVFLHYVDQAGPYAAWRNDNRPMLGLFKPKNA
jgi:hypothetical protein